MVKEDKILVNEIFQSIDGEGYHAGYPSVFFRVTGCNLRCAWCDSTYTFKEEASSRYLSVKEALEEVLSYSISHVTITGGEPLLEENREWMTEFIACLLESREFVVDIETNGSVDYSYWKRRFKDYGSRFVLITDWKAPSSKMNSFMIESNLRLLDSWDLVKVVVEDEDFEEVHRILPKIEKAQVYLSPVFGKVTLQKLPEFVMAHKEYTNLRVQVQLHKIFWSPETRSV